MPNRLRHILVITALVLAASALSGCGTINEKLANGAGDILPVWAGGLPRDVPPRQGTPEYDAFMKERERKRLIPAAERGDDPKELTKDATKPAPTSTSQDAVH
ncbi:hypothetical protein UP10_35075 [Bradyrhizobium sp. LTSPM299]|uniref:hypothetical protein n=1 Tax=Bradyrhizobium sp. LTSPM299 TaxID=1619233 RepID=UPI0005C98297|nr:hypothetical protein [Bradyrhizobium sp. LTSPM299]KJC56244.1 hypothetical protein UP10_35075 [Bradyrhizobium sp. LTSPM299]